MRGSGASGKTRQLEHFKLKGKCLMFILHYNFEKLVQISNSQGHSTDVGYIFPTVLQKSSAVV